MHTKQKMFMSAAFTKTKSPPSWQARQETKSARIITFPSYITKHLQDYKKNDIQFSSEKEKVFPADALSETKNVVVGGGENIRIIKNVSSK